MREERKLKEKEGKYLIILSEIIAIIYW